MVHLTSDSHRVALGQEAEDEATEEAEAAQQGRALERASALGRAHPAASLPLITALLHQHQHALLHTSSGSESTTPPPSPLPSLKASDQDTLL